jgi:hypothetical protein
MKKSKKSNIEQFEDYKQSKSDTVELYYSIPKYHYEDFERERFNGKYLPILRREFECGGCDYSPA